MAKTSSAKTAVRYVYLHGFASSPLSTKGVQLHRWFEKKFHISLEIPDLNIPSFRQQCLSHMVDHVERLIINSNALWFLIGSSFGGLVSTLVAQRQPHSIHSLLLLAPAFNPIERWTSKFDVTQWKTTGFLNHFNPTTQTEEPIEYEFFNDLHAHSSYPIVTTCPITIIHGIHDDVVPIETSREYTQKVRLVNQHRTLMIEVDDDHHLRKKKTLNTIKKIILDHQKFSQSTELQQ